MSGRPSRPGRLAVAPLGDGRGASRYGPGRQREAREERRGRAARAGSGRRGGGGDPRGCDGRAARRASSAPAPARACRVNKACRRLLSQRGRPLSQVRRIFTLCLSKLAEHRGPRDGSPLFRPPHHAAPVQQGPSAELSASSASFRIPAFISSAEFGVGWSYVFCSNVSEAAAGRTVPNGKYGNRWDNFNEPKSRVPRLAPMGCGAPRRVRAGRLPLSGVRAPRPAGMRSRPAARPRRRPVGHGQPAKPLPRLSYRQDGGRERAPADPRHCRMAGVARRAAGRK